MPGIFTTVPDEYKAVSQEELAHRIRQHKENKKDEIVILAHHYQRKEIVALGDFRGDSFALSRIASNLPNARHIIFCGVNFMAESARILCRPEQIVYLPNPYAGCPMADMADIDQVLESWEQLTQIVPKEKVAPVSYMNSSAALKAFCGENRGLTCTSSNADKAFQYAFSVAEKLFFFPDEHLGTNTARKLGIPKQNIILWDPISDLGGHTEKEIREAKLILWKGHCHVHTNFKVEHIKNFREKYPGGKVVVHPECTEDVVELADAVGSTEFIVRYVSSQAPGSIIAIGTELNLISRLADENPDKKIFELTGQDCPMCVNMFRTSLADLCYTLDNLGKVNVIEVDENIKKNAHLALERMLNLN